MTQLRKAMLEELQRRNMSQITTRIYLRAVEEFAQCFKTPPDRRRGSGGRKRVPAGVCVARRVPPDVARANAQGCRRRRSLLGEWSASVVLVSRSAEAGMRAPSCGALLGAA